MYNSTPHSTTGVAPSRLMFGRLLRDKLPSVHESAAQLTEDIRDRDWTKKLQGAEQANRRRQAKDNNLSEGDVVVARRTVKENKLSSNFSPEQFEVVNRKKSEAEIRSKTTGKTYFRNVSHLKPIIPTAKSQDRIPGTCQEESPEPAESEDTTEAEEIAIEESRAEPRIQRNQKRPKYLQDYVTNVELNCK